MFLRYDLGGTGGTGDLLVGSDEPENDERRNSPLVTFEWLFG